MGKSFRGQWFGVQAYPTAVRTFGLGVANMCARLGAALAPFFAVYLVRHSLAPLAEVSLAVACFLAAAVSLCIPAGTAASSHLVSRCNQNLDSTFQACFHGSSQNFPNLLVFVRIAYLLSSSMRLKEFACVMCEQSCLTSPLSHLQWLRNAAADLLAKWN